MRWYIEYFHAITIERHKNKSHVLCVCVSFKEIPLKISFLMMQGDPIPSDMLKKTTKHTPNLN